MERYKFQRECRSLTSEVFIILDEEGRRMGQVDLHYTGGVVQGSLFVTERLTSDNIQELIDTIDEDMVTAAGIPREDFVVTVFQGREAGVYSDQEVEVEDQE